MGNLLSGFEIRFNDEDSQQARQVKLILNSEFAIDEKLRRLSEYLKTQDLLEKGTKQVLKLLKGPYGSENLYLISSRVIAEFWLSVHLLFPDDVELTFFAADSNFTPSLANEEVYGPLFIKAMLARGTIHDVGGEIGEVLLAGRFRFDYQIVFLRQLLNEKHQKDANDEIEELLQEYKGDEEKIKLIRSAIAQNKH